MPSSLRHASSAGPQPGKLLRNANDQVFENFFFTLDPKNVKDDADASTGPKSCTERVNRFDPGR